MATEDRTIEDHTIPGSITITPGATVDSDLGGVDARLRSAAGIGPALAGSLPPTLNPDGGIDGGSPNKSIPGDISPIEDPAAGSREQALGAQIDRSRQTEIITDAESGLITIRNTTGSTVTIAANGDITISSTRAVSVNSASDMSFSADGNMSFDCNQFSIQTRGNALFNVEGDYTLGVTGDKQESITNSNTQSVFGDNSVTVRGSSTNVVLGDCTNAIMGSSSHIIRGNCDINSQGPATFTSGGTLKMTSEGTMYITAPNLNAAAGNISIFGATGFIGGDGVVHRGQAMYATTFHGDLFGNVEGNLDGTAAHAINAKTAQSTATYTGDESIAVINFDNKFANLSIDADNIDAFLNSGPGGIVDLDIDDEIIKYLDPSFFTDGILSRFPTMDEIRNLLRDRLNRLNPALTNWLIERGLLSPTFRNAVPRGVNGIGGSTIRPRTGLPGSGRPGGSRGDGFGGPPGGGGVTTNPNRNVDRYEPNPPYDPNNLGTEEGQPGEAGRITRNLLVGEGVPISSFLRQGARLDTLTATEQQQFARYCHIHTTYFYNKYKGDAVLNGGRLQILSGLYTPPGTGGAMTPGGINDLAQTGRVAAYEVLGAGDKQDLDATYGLAVKMRNYEIFEKIILDYDTYEPPDIPDTPENPFFSQRNGTRLEDGSIVNTKIVVILPEFDNTYVFGRASFANETQLNGEVLGEYLFNIVTGSGALDHDIDNAIVPELRQILIEIGDRLGLRIGTRSGDRGATGSGRHNRHALDTELFLGDRQLSVRDAGDLPYIQEFTRAFIQTARSRGFRPSVGIEGPNSLRLSGGYMGGNAFHYDIAAGRVIAANRAFVWGDDDDAGGDSPPGWLIQMFNE